METTMKLHYLIRPSAASLTAAVLSLGLSGLPYAAQAQAQAPAPTLKHYDSTKPDFWKHPPPDWFLGDETAQQKALSPKAGPATGMSADEINAALKNIKLPPGFHISLFASGVNSARQMAWGDKGT